MIVRRTSELAGTVVWLSGYEVERYPDFASFFEALIGHNNQVTARMTGKNGA